MARHFPKGSYPCTRCDRKFSYQMHLARHVSTMHRKKAKRAPRPAVAERAAPAVSKTPPRSLIVLGGSNRVMHGYHRGQVRLGGKTYLMFEQS